MNLRHTATTIAAAGLIAAGLFVPAAQPTTDSTATQQPIAATAAADPELPAALDALLQDPRYAGSQVGLVVRDADTGEELYDRGGGDRLLPASTMKLFTSAAAMDTLGADFRFHTDVLAKGTVNRGVLHGTLYLKGYGDPTTLAADYRELAQQVADAGIRRVSAGLVADDSYFDSTRLAPFWSWDDEPYYYSAQTSALTVAPDTDYDSGTLIVTATPGSKAGAAPRVSLTPRTGVVEIVNTATTGSAGSDDTLSIERDHGSNIVRVSGSVPADGDATEEWVTVWEPTTYAADVFARALRAAGVQVDRGVRTGPTPENGTRTIASDTSMTLGDMLTPFLKLSNNMHAEALTKTLGAEATGTGSWSAGVDAIGSFADSVGVDVDTLNLTDGSGLSRADYLTADALSDLLIAATSEPWYDQWYAALPIAGNPDRMIGGTLRNRLRGTSAADNLHAKTGSMTGVTALAGYVTDADGRLLTVAMISNNFLSSPQPIEDAVAITLASYSAGATITRRTAAAPESAPTEQREWCLVKTC